MRSQDAETSSQDREVAGSTKLPATGSGSKDAGIKKASGHPTEHTPLLPESGDGDADGLTDGQTEFGEHDDHEATRSIWYLIFLTLSIGGLQIAWSVELSNGSPYLLSLGITKSLMALVWIAGPLSGTLVQPYVGIRSDNCRISWGRRKPFMLGGAAATIVSLMALGWTREWVGGLCGLLGYERQDHTTRLATATVAVLFVYILDFAINTVQAAIRAFIVDCAPTHQQESANAMASRVLGIGNIAGYVFGYINLPKYLWFLGDTQFKVLCAIASIALGTTVVISCLVIKERDPNLNGPPQDHGGVVSFFKSVFRTIKYLPPQTRKVCEVQFFAWIGWFPFLFYMSTWIGELYVQPILKAHPHLDPDELDTLYEKGIRVGTFALLVWACSSLISNLFLPFLIAPTYDAPPTLSTSSTKAQQPYSRLDKFLDRLIIPWLTLRRAWLISLILIGIGLLSTLFIQTPTTATIVVAVIGIPWALTLWAPFAIISAEISHRASLLRRNLQYQSQVRSPPATTAAAGQEYVDDPTAAVRAATSAITDDDSDTTDPTNDANIGDQAGVILGIHNVSISSPQVFATVGSSLIFKIFQKPRGTPGDRSMPIVLATGGIFALIAAYMASRLAEEKPVLLPRFETREDGTTVATGRPRPISSLSRNASFGSALGY